jgi:hypothetical protein
MRPASAKGALADEDLEHPLTQIAAFRRRWARRTGHRANLCSQSVLPPAGSVGVPRTTSSSLSVWIRGRAHLRLHLRARTGTSLDSQCAPVMPTGLGASARQTAGGDVHRSPTVAAAMPHDLPATTFLRRVQCRETAELPSGQIGAPVVSAGAGGPRPQLRGDHIQLSPTVAATAPDDVAPHPLARVARHREAAEPLPG